jgi:DNA-directed RNA polymerase subunit RPC12/RpoP
LSKLRYFLAKCPRCGRFTGIRTSGKSRVCPYCGARISQRDRTSSMVYEGSELAEVVKSANEFLDEGENSGN